MPREIEIRDGSTRWRFEPSFLRSNWTCIWGRGCKGILDVPAEHLGQGCCSVGAEIDEHEAATIDANARFLRPEHFQHHETAEVHGVFADETRSNTRIVDGACIFLNRPGFPGGEGCALHLAALADGESPLDWKPSVCWQLPIKIDWTDDGDGTEVATVHGWTRGDWGELGETMAWCCTEEPEAFVGDRPVADALAEELTALVGQEVYDELRSRLDAPH